MILFDRGTYNRAGTLLKASLLGMRVTEIPPRVFMRRLPEEEFKKHGELVRKFEFPVVMAHGPYYDITTSDEEAREKALKAHLRAKELAKTAGAEIYIVQLGVRDEKAGFDVVKDSISKIIDDKLVIAIKNAYADRERGTLEEIKELIELNPERMTIALQLENAFLLEHVVYEDLDIHRADLEATEDYRYDLLERARKLPGRSEYLVLRFSQVTVFYKGRMMRKKRVPLGRGYPSLDPMLNAIARFMVDKRKSGESRRIVFEYTGPSENKYRDAITLFASLMYRISDLIERAF